MQKIKCFLAILLSVCFLFGCTSNSSTSSVNNSKQTSSIMSAVDTNHTASSSEATNTIKYKWVIEPFLNYDTMYSVMGSELDEKSFQYLNVSSGNLTGAIHFDDGSELFPLDVRHDLFVCQPGYLHSYISDFADPDIDFQAIYDDLGIPFTPCGRHGIIGLFYQYLISPSTGEQGIYAIDVSGSYYKVDTLHNDIPEILICFEADLDENGFFQERPSTYTLVRSDGSQISSEQFSADEYFKMVGNKMALFSKDHKVRYFNTENGKFASQNNFDALYLGYEEERDTTIYHFDDIYGYFNEGLCPVNMDSKYGYINTNGDIVIPFEFDGATHVFNNKAWVKQNGLWGQIEILVS